MSFHFFISMWFGLLALAHLYVGHRIIGPTRIQGRKKTFAWLLVGLVFLIPQIHFFSFVNKIQSSWIDALAWPGYTILGCFSLILAFVAIRDLLSLITTIAARVGKALSRRVQTKSNQEIDRERRRFLIHSTNLGIVGLSVVATGYGLYEARRRATIEQVDVPLQNLPPEFNGFRIVQFTDLHVGPTIKRRFVEGIAEQLYDLKGDILAFTGDLVDGSVSWLKDDVAPLQDLNAPYGKFFITGNHEYYSGAGAWVQEAGRLGFDVLMNEHRLIERGRGAIVLAGVTDYSGGDYLPSHRSDPVAAVSNAPNGLVRILLAHQPRSIFAATQVVVDLQISGHTHGGQFFPWNHLATLNQPYIKGLHRHENTWIYVSRGTGYWGPPLRLGIPPEITVITLREMKGA